ncbi:hypothetical protein PENSPDRAFT_741190 [Peniophora sp. CONT]|nr:hypothetical protein PENSPDRAFT_741190 [Peniophora sp. CONT]
MNVPFTPRPRTNARKKNLTLSAKEYNKVSSTIASVRRNRERLDGDDEYATRRDHEPSFIAEESFVRAPLNSRVSGLVQPSPKAKGKERAERLDTLPLEVQEALILEDLLFVLMGIEGTHITFHDDYSPQDDDPLEGVKFVVDRSLDPSLRDLAERVLPLATYYTAITAFIEQRAHSDYGLVNHALCARMRDMLRDYQTLLAQLEHAFSSSSSFSLQKLWFYVHPTVHTLALLYHLTLALAHADDAPEDEGGSQSSEDDDLAARDAALGLTPLNPNIFSASATSAPVPVKGGEVLSILHARAQSLSGDPAARSLYSALLTAAGKPYVDIVRGWTRKGRLDDPYEEVCVKEARFITRGTLDMDYTDEYWERRYTLRDGSTASLDRRSQTPSAGIPPPRAQSGKLPGGACVPPALEAWKHKILLAGKYLNVIRECGIDIARPDSPVEDERRPRNVRGEAREEEEFGLDSAVFLRGLEADYAFANTTLLARLLAPGPGGLLARLRALRRYLFLAHAPFLPHFLELAQSELRRPARAASIGRLQSLLELALNADAHGDDAEVKGDLKIVLAGSALTDFLIKIVQEKGDIAHTNDGAVSEAGGEKGKEKEKLTALDALSLDFAVPFPLSLVVSRKTVLRYQLIFRFLLHLKSLEQSLSTMWLDHKSSAWRVLPSHASPDFEKWRRRVALLRLRMLAFVQQLLAYVTSEVVEPNWRRFEERLGKVGTVDALLRDHVDFLDTCSKECMMTSDAKLLKAHGRLVTVCQTFVLYSAPFTKAATLAMAPDGESSDAIRKRWDTLGRFEIHFDRWFDEYLGCVQLNASRENVALLPLVLRLHSIKRPVAATNSQ